MCGSLVMKTLTPLQINDAKREGLDEYFRALSIKFMYYDALEVSYAWKHRPPPVYLIGIDFPYESANLQISHPVSNH